jgi:hypothetical protein
MVPLQNRDVTSATSNAPPSASAEWAKVIDMDRDLVRRGLMSPEVIPYDLQMAQLIPEGEEIMVTHDKTKARIWSKKYNAIVAGRNAAAGKMTAKAKALAAMSATSGAFADQKPDACLSPMGKNICAAPPSQQGSVKYVVGPGGIGATVGGILLGPGGISGTIGQ